MSKYTIEVTTIRATGSVPSNCNAITFFNQSGATILINTVPIASGATFSIEGNVGEMDTTNYSIECAGYVYIIRKFYV